MRSFVPRGSALLVTAILALPAGAAASSITVGTANSNNCIPTSCPGAFAVGTYQQVYSSTAFSSMTSISAITFFFFEPDSLGTALAGGTYSLSFSTTAAAVNGLSPTFAANVGGSSQAFFSGALPAATPTSLTISGTPYAYDPTLGNLLLTINVVGAIDPPSVSFMQADRTGSVTSRAFGASPTGTADSFGLVTQFDTTVIPEPASVLLLGIGLAAAAVGRRQVRRRAARTAP